MSALELRRQTLAEQRMALQEQQYELQGEINQWQGRHAQSREDRDRIDTAITYLKIEISKLKGMIASLTQGILECDKDTNPPVRHGNLWCFGNSLETLSGYTDAREMGICMAACSLLPHRS